MEILIILFVFCNKRAHYATIETCYCLTYSLAEEDGNKQTWVKRGGFYMIQSSSKEILCVCRNNKMVFNTHCEDKIIKVYYLNVKTWV